MFWKWGKRIGLGLFCLVALLLFSGASYQFISTKIDKSKYPPLGRMIDVGGYKLHLHSTGSGGPSVILDAGLGCVGADWGLVQPEIAKFTQVVSYDRAGNAWSEPSPFPRTSQQIVQELHTLLQNANIPKPYILVGHSFGGSNVQLYAATYPNEVLGIVLVDSCHEEQEKKLPFNPLLESQKKLMQNTRAVYLMSCLGVSRFTSKAFLKTMTRSLPESMQNTHLALCSTTKNTLAVTAESNAFTESLKQLEDADHSLIENIPCFVLTAGLETDLSPFGVSAEVQEVMSQTKIVWGDLQRDLAAKFHNSHHLIAEKSDHMIPWNQPELIVHAVHELVKIENEVL